MQHILTSYAAIFLARAVFFFSFLGPLFLSLCLRAVVASCGRWGDGIWGIVLAARCVCARATRRVGFGGASGRAASETASRRSAQHRVRPGAFVLHQMDRTADV